MDVRLSNSNRRPVWKGLMLFCLVLMASCEKHPTENIAEPGMVVLDLSALISPEARSQTRAVDGDRFPPRNEDYPIGLWICEAEEDAPADFTPAMRGYDNLLASLAVAAKSESEHEEVWNYVFEGRNHNTLSVRQNTAVDIYAYYPRVEMEEGGEGFTPAAVPFTSGETDWMWANFPDGYENTNGKAWMNLTAAQTDIVPAAQPVTVPFRFHHAMTCIQVSMKCKYSGNVRLISMTLTDSKGRLYKKGTMNAWTGRLALDEGDKGSEITITPNATLGIAEQDFCIMMPAVDGYENNQFTLSFVYQGINGQTPGRETFSLPDKMKSLSSEGEVTITGFETGKRYIYRLTLDNTMRFAPVGVDEEWAAGMEEIDLEL